MRRSITSQPSKMSRRSLKRSRRTLLKKSLRTRPRLEEAARTDKEAEVAKREEEEAETEAEEEVASTEMELMKMASRSSRLARTTRTREAEAAVVEVTEEEEVATDLRLPRLKATRLTWVTTRSTEEVVAARRPAMSPSPKVSRKPNEHV